MLIGVLSDTHGTIHPAVIPLFRSPGVELILHAGDVGKYDVIEQLGQVAPVEAVRGNVDVAGQVAKLPDVLFLDLGGVKVYIKHIGGRPGDWLPQLPEPMPSVAICGHSHAPLLDRHEGILFLNASAAGTRRRFGLPFSAAILNIEAGAAEARLVNLEEL